jgi:dihydrofolate reductase
MGKLILSGFVTLDGVMEKPWEWAGPWFDKEGKDHSTQELKKAEWFLLGRKTYQQFVASWPQIQGEAYFDEVNAMKKIVVSQSLRHEDWNADILNGDVPARLQALKEQSSKNIIKYGIGALGNTLIQHNVVDEFHFSLIPISLGKGAHTFEGLDTSAFTLQLKQSKTFKNGVVNLVYIPVKK